MKIFFVRHGETDHNRDRKIIGEVDPPLNALGVNQSKAAADFIKRHAPNNIKIYSSPKVRAIQTAEIISGKLASPVLLTNGLTERNLGPYEGCSINTLESNRIKKGHLFLDVTQDWESCLEVEQDASVAERVLNALRLGSEEQDNVIAVCHAGVIKSMFHILFDIPLGRKAVLKIRNGGVLLLEERLDFWAFEGLFNPSNLS